MSTKVFLSVPLDADGNELNPVFVVEGTGEYIAERDACLVDIDDPTEVINAANKLLKEHNLALDILYDGTFEGFWLRVKPLT